MIRMADPIDESKFPYGYVPDRLKERVKNGRSLTVAERMELTCELSEAAWAKIGFVRDPMKPMDKTIRRFRCDAAGKLEPHDSAGVQPTLEADNSAEGGEK